MRRLSPSLAIVAWMIALLAFFTISPGVQPKVLAQAGCPLSLNVPMQSSNGQLGVTIDITALKSTTLCRFWIQASTTGTHTVQVWRHPNGSVGSNDGLWQYIGQATITMPTANVNTELPVDINMTLSVGEKWGFALLSNNSIRYSTVSTPTSVSDSYITVGLSQWGLSGTANPAAGTTAFASWFTPRGFVGIVQYKEGCFFPVGQHSLSIADASGNPLTYANIPGQVFAKLAVSYPAGAANVTSTLKFFRIGGSTVVPEYTYQFISQKSAGLDLNVLQAVPIPSTMQPGFYRVVPVLYAPNSCGNMQELVLGDVSLMLIYPNSTICVVWPGDVNNDGMVNYADRKSLNQYIQDAASRSSWLFGPGRYRADAATNPMTYMAWEGQAGIPWQTPEGCYMDADGNGAINGLDYMTIKVNWNRAHTASRSGLPQTSMSFDVRQNYPNPFNPTTTISYDLPERSQVRLVVTDMLGRELATLVNEAFDAGTHLSTFDATTLPSGSYIAVIRATGLESGTTFTKTIKMTLAK